MIGKTFEIATSPTAPLVSGNYPGHGYRVSHEAGMVIERDVAVALRDGTRMYVDIYRSAEVDTDCPTLIGWSPYGKHGLKNIGLMPGADVNPSWVSKYAMWEGPDPAFWCKHGYVVISPDPRGAWHSEGQLTFWSDQEAADGYDLIEWAAAQSWSNGKVGMLGVSYLAISQWLIAATRPPHLAAICPWEGFSDPYRDVAAHGGIPERRFWNWWQPKSRFSLSPAEDMLSMLEQHPLLDDYWNSKTAELARIDVPAYVVGSWVDQGMHTRGTLEGFKQIGSAHKWLELHGRKKWRHFFHPDSVARQKQFFDQFLKEIDTGVLEWPKVRMEVRTERREGEFRDEQEWPLARTQYKKLFLDAASGRLSADVVDLEGEVRYDATQPAAQVRFDYLFDQATELSGHMKLRLWVHAEGANDMDLFVAIQKLDRQGEEVGFPFFAVFEKGPVALGWIRASHRELDETRSKPHQPWLRHRRELLLEPGEVVPLEIEIWPSSTRFEKGESLRVLISGSDIYNFDSVAPQNGHRTRNAGVHAIHAGGRWDSHLLIPVIPARG
jgi:hypothetical protein